MDLGCFSTHSVRKGKKISVFFLTSLVLKRLSLGVSEEGCALLSGGNPPQPWRKFESPGTSFLGSKICFQTRLLISSKQRTHFHCHFRKKNFQFQVQKLSKCALLWVFSQPLSLSWQPLSQVLCVFLDSGPMMVFTKFEVCMSLFKETRPFSFLGQIH